MTSPGLANAHARHIKSDCLPSVSGKGVIWWKLLPAFCFCWPSWECCSLLSCREDKDVRILIQFHVAMFERFTEQARCCMHLARQSATKYGSQTIETEQTSATSNIRGSAVECFLSRATLTPSPADRRAAKIG